MSVFDKFRANPYVSTYIGAPVNEMAQAMAARTRRADQFYAQEDALEDAFRQDSHLKQDDAMFNESQKEIRAQIEELAKNPHQSQRQIKALSRQYANNDNLKVARSNYKAYQDWQAKFDEDPTKFGGDIVAGIAANKLANYGGAAAGDKLQFDSLYEHKDINKTLTDAAKTIKQQQDVIQTIDGRFLNTKTKKYITPEQASQVLMGTLMNDPTVVKQIQEAAGFYGMDPKAYAMQLIQPQVSAITNPQYDIKSQALPKEGTGSGSGSGFGTGVGATHAGPSMVDETHGAFRGMDARGIIRQLRTDDSPANDVVKQEFVEFYTNQLGQEAASVQDKHLVEYIKETGMDGIDEMQLGNTINYKRWHLNKYGEAGEISDTLGRKLSSSGVNDWFGDAYGDGAGNAFADKYSTTTTNMVIEEAHIALQDMGYSSGDVTKLRQNAWTQVGGQAQVEMLDPETGKPTMVGQEDFAAAGYKTGELIGFGQSSDYGEFKVTNAEGVEEIVYIKMPADRFGLTAQRFNQGIKKGYGDGTNVNYAQLGKSAMGLNPNLGAEARTAANRAFGGDTDVTIPLSNFSNRMEGFAELRRDADGDYTVNVNGKNMLASNPEAAAALTNAINSQDASTLAGILSGIGVELNKTQ